MLTNETSQETSLIHSTWLYYAWEVADKPATIRLNLNVIDRLSGEVTAKFADLSSRASEIGGILLGRIADELHKTFFIEDYELVACGHRDSTLFALSDECKSQMTEQLLRLKTSSPHSIVGFFRSHTRKNLSLDECDLCLIREYFPGPSTVFLLVKPFATKPSMAGFFIWEDGTIRAGSSYREFPFKKAELMIRMPQSIVGGGSEQLIPTAAPAVTVPSVFGSSASTHKPLPTTLKPAPARELTIHASHEFRTGAGLDDSLSAILRRITRDHAEQSVFSGGTELDRGLHTRGRLSPEPSIMSDQSGDHDYTQLPQFSEQSFHERRNRFDSVESDDPAEARSRSFYNLSGHKPDTTFAESSHSLFRSEAALQDNSTRQKFCAAARRTALRLCSLSTLLWLLIPLALGTAFLSFRTINSNNALNLLVDSDGRQFDVHWNRRSNVIAAASKATLQIRDGSYAKDLELNAEELRTGSAVYLPATDNVEFRLQVNDSGKAEVTTEWLQATRRPAARPQEIALDQNIGGKIGTPHQQADTIDTSGRGTTSSAIAPLLKTPVRLTKEPDNAGVLKHLQEPHIRDRKSLLSNAPIIPATLVRSIPPEYPPAALSAHVSGVVSVQGVVGADGTVKRILGASGPALLRPSAVEAVGHFVYKPATRGGQPIESATLVYVNFLP